MQCIVYKGGYKYQLKRSYELTIPLRPEADIRTSYVALDAAGLLWMRNGYAWDGPSGPTIDTRNFMRGSLVHDALYQLMREGSLDPGLHRIEADRILRAICREDGMSALRSAWVYQAVRLFGDPAADPALKRPLTTAPAGCSD